MQTELLIHTTIITGEQKRALETLTTSDIFKQRKQYDEYYITQEVVLIIVSLYQLTKLSEWFTVVITPNGIIIGDK